jgi:hypothetical protein
MIYLKHKITEDLVVLVLQDKFKQYFYVLNILGFMIRINNKLKHKSWYKTLEDAIIKRDELVESS